MIQPSSKRLILGGSQEAQLRAGTANLPAVLAAAEAYTLRHRDFAEDLAHACALQARFETALRSHFRSDVLRITAADVPRSPSMTHLAFWDLDGPGLLAALDLAGIAASAGSACAAGALERSEVATAIGLPERWSALLRFSWGREAQRRKILIVPSSSCLVA